MYSQPPYDCKELFTTPEQVTVTHVLTPQFSFWYSHTSERGIVEAARLLMVASANSGALR